MELMVLNPNLNVFLNADSVCLVCLDSHDHGIQLYFTIIIPLIHEGIFNGLFHPLGITQKISFQLFHGELLFINKKKYE